MYRHQNNQMAVNNLIPRLHLKGSFFLVLSFQKHQWFPFFFGLYPSCPFLQWHLYIMKKINVTRHYFRIIHTFYIMLHKYCTYNMLFFCSVDVWSVLLIFWILILTSAMIRFTFFNMNISVFCLKDGFPAKTEHKIKHAVINLTNMERASQRKSKIPSCTNFTPYPEAHFLLSLFSSTRLKSPFCVCVCVFSFFIEKHRKFTKNV